MAEASFEVEEVDVATDSSIVNGNPPQAAMSSKNSAFLYSGKGSHPNGKKSTDKTRRLSARRLPCGVPCLPETESSHPDPVIDIIQLFSIPHGIQ